MCNLLEMGGKNPNYLGSFDFVDMDADHITVTIKGFRQDSVVSERGTENCTVMFFEESAYKPMILNVTNKKRLVRLFGTKDTAGMIGKRIMIHTEKVKAFGSIHDALRVMQNLPKQDKSSPDQKILCEKCGAEIEGVGNMNAEQIAAYTMKKYGHKLCGACAKKEASGNEDK